MLRMSLLSCVVKSSHALFVRLILLGINFDAIPRKLRIPVILAGLLLTVLTRQSPLVVYSLVESSGIPRSVSPRFGLGCF